MNADVITLHNRSSLQAPFHSCWSMDSAIALPHAPCRDSWRKTSWFPVQGGFVRQSEYIWDCLTWNQCLLLQVHKGIHGQHSTNCWQLYRTCFYRRDIPLLDPQSSLSRDFTAFCFSWRKSKTKHYTADMEACSYIYMRRAKPVAVHTCTHGVHLAQAIIKEYFPRSLHTSWWEARFVFEKSCFSFTNRGYSFKLFFEVSNIKMRRDVNRGPGGRGGGDRETEKCFQHRRLV